MSDRYGCHGRGGGGGGGVESTTGFFFHSFLFSLALFFSIVIIVLILFIFFFFFFICCCRCIPYIKSLSATLETLELCGGGITDEGVICLAMAPPLMTSLTRLSLNQNKQVTDRGAAAIGAGLPNLRELNLSGAQLHWKGLACLTLLRNLQSLVLNGCGVSNGVAQQLKLAMPNLTNCSVGQSREEAIAAVKQAAELAEREREDRGR